MLTNRNQYSRRNSRLAAMAETPGLGWQSGSDLFMTMSSLRDRDRCTPRDYSIAGLAQTLVLGSAISRRDLWERGRTPVFHGLRLLPSTHSTGADVSSKCPLHAPWCPPKEYLCTRTAMP